jgi:hypothetical protein
LPIKSELDALTKHHVWDIIPCEKNMQVVPVKWVFTVKDDGTHKARLVVRSCSDKEVYSALDSASPTPSIATVQWVIAVAVVHFAWSMRQI